MIKAIHKKKAISAEKDVHKRPSLVLAYFSYIHPTIKCKSLPEMTLALPALVHSYQQMRKRVFLVIIA